MRWEAPFDLIIFNPPWVPQPSERVERSDEADVIFGNDYPPELFPRLFSDVTEAMVFAMIFFWERFR